MTFDLKKITESKRAFRQRLAVLPIEEKLAMLDDLRGRLIALRETRPAPEPTTLRENPSPYRARR